MEVLTNITWNGPSRGAGEREIFKAFRKNTFSSIVCMNGLHHVDNKALCSMSVLKFGETSTSNNLPVFTALIKLSAFADAFVKQSANNSDLKCEQDHEHSLNRLPFASWKS